MPLAPTPGHPRWSCPGRRRAGAPSVTRSQAGLPTVFYGVLFALERVLGDPKGMAIRFTHRGWICYSILQHIGVFLTFWSLSILVGKILMVRRRRDSLRATFVPHDAPLDTKENLERASVFTTSRRVRDHVLGHCIQRAP